MAKKQFDCCPHCGGTSGFVFYSDYKNVPYMIGFHGEQQDNTEMYDYALVIEKENLYCQDCGKLICRKSTGGL